MKTQPPVIVIMGHVDHGKTTLLDYIRETNVAEQESGGITQSIGAYEIEHDNKQITFLDTPGHEAFSKMRARGAQVADLAIVVVAADDGVQPQTKEALEYIKKVDIPYIVAINKIDLSTADVEKTINELTKNEVYLEGRGGDVSYQPISAKRGTGVDELLDLINLAAEVEELEYDPEADGKGVIINSFNDPQKGVITGAIVQDGKIEAGDPVFTESAEGRVRSLENFRGEAVESLEPSSPALILGFNDIPKVGEKIQVGEKPEGAGDEENSQDIKSLKDDEIGVIAKAEESGSLEVLEALIENFSTEEVKLKVVRSDVGNITKDDTNLASSTDSLVIGFNVDIDKAAKNMIKNYQIPVFTSSVIYDLEEKLNEYTKEELGAGKRAIQILDTFGESGNKQIIGGQVIKGAIKNKENFELYESDEKIGKGRIVNLQSQKENVERAEEGDEVGLMAEADTDIEKGHILLFGTS